MAEHENPTLMEAVEGLLKIRIQRRILQAIENGASPLTLDFDQLIEDELAEATEIVERFVSEITGRHRALDVDALPRRTPDDT